MFLTQAATPLLEKIDDVVNQARREMLAGLSEAEIRQLDALLEHIENNGLAIQARESDG